MTGSKRQDFPGPAAEDIDGLQTVLSGKQIEHNFKLDTPILIENITAKED